MPGVSGVDITLHVGGDVNGSAESNAVGAGVNTITCAAKFFVRPDDFERGAIGPADNLGELRTERDAPSAEEDDRIINGLAGGSLVDAGLIADKGKQVPLVVVFVDDVAA